MERYIRTYARISLDAIEHNFDQLKACLSPSVKTMAVVKANAYGHGSVPVARRLEQKADYFAVASLEEGIELRKGGIQKPILILSYTPPSLYEELLEYHITPSLYDVEEASILSQLAEKRGVSLPVHVAVDTGMGRIGFQPDAAGADSILEISCMPGIVLEGLFSHYATADSRDKTEALKQTARFDCLVALLEERGVKIPLKHICNSAGCMEMEKKYDLCRFGIALYGLYPSDEVDRSAIRLIPAMEVFSHVIHVKTVPAGTKIGYGHTYEAPCEKTIATVSIGYADGFNRCLSGVGYVLIAGKRAPVVGRVCMDQIMVDVTGLDEVLVDDTATVLGRDGEACITAEELGSLCHSFNYEVVCTFLPRVVRIYEEKKENQ